ncbi:MAG: P-loop NTPase, partial [Acidimicrobiales bacterium]
MRAPDEGQIRAAMRGVVDPELGDDVVELGMYLGSDVDAQGAVTVQLALTTAACPLRTQLQRDVTARVGSLPGVSSVSVRTSEMDREQRRALMDRARSRAQQRAPATRIPARTRVLAVSSGKGGVGKSSITVNLAVSLAGRGHHVGLLDADIAGFSVPRMLGMEGRIGAQRVEEGGESRLALEPLRKPFGAGQLEVLSMGFLSGEDEAIMWRGLMLNRAVQHFVEDARWGDLDYLLVDMPPGTGDVQMGLARMLPRAEMLIVTTPALAAQKVAARAADMARRGHLRVAGVIENMSGFTCEHGHHHDLFGRGGGERLAVEIGAGLLAQIPIEAEVSAGGDAGEPAALGDGPAAEAFGRLADAVLSVAPVVEMRDCSARLLDALGGGLGSAGAVAPTTVPSPTVPSPTVPS